MSDTIRLEGLTDAGWRQLASICVVAMESPRCTPNERRLCERIINTERARSAVAA